MLTLIACILAAVTTYCLCEQKYKSEISKLTVHANLLYQQGYDVGFSDCKNMTFTALKKR